MITTLGGILSFLFWNNKSSELIHPSTEVTTTKPLTTLLIMRNLNIKKQHNKWKAMMNRYWNNLEKFMNFLKQYRARFDQLLWTYYWRNQFETTSLNKTYQKYCAPETFAMQTFLNQKNSNVMLLTRLIYKLFPEHLGALTSTVP